MIQEAELGTSYQKKAIIEKKFDYIVRIEWNYQTIDWWNESCAMVMQVFGLPGNRFIYHSSEDYMQFRFHSEKDQQLCRIMLSEKL